MWWGTRLTFHSQRILRHLVRLQLATGDFDKSKRTLHLYVQLVSKNRQTAVGAVSLQLKRRPTDLPAEHPDTIAEELDEKADGLERAPEEDADADDVFLDILLMGVRMMCKYGGDEDVKEAKRMMAIARDVIGDATPDPTEAASDASPARKWPSKTRAKYLATQGVLSSRAVDFEHSETERPRHLTQARDHLLESTTLDPSSPTAFYHLACIQSALRDVDAAVLSARQAVELAPNDARTWHLLGLLLTAQEDWENALQVLELGIVKTHEDMALSTPDREAEEPVATGNGEHKQLEPGVDAQDFGASNGSAVAADSTPDHSDSLAAPPAIPSASSKSLKFIISPKAGILPSPADLHYPIPIVPFMQTHEKFTASIQLLLSQLVLSERYEGAERANERWPDVFAFFSGHCPSGPPDGSTRGSLFWHFLCARTYDLTLFLAHVDRRYIF
ncbi:hypothetical protein DL93DRAFT_2073084 [Clavulina sp. PMI_390]|nr:hypothetical protein DL93DRAFT_2073084 [Clavulina sp. PMI_390]